MISAKVVCDTLRPDCQSELVKINQGNKGYRDVIGRINTLVLTYPRWIHSEFMTHRDRARNAASSRAVSVKKSIENVEFLPFESSLLTEKKGMSGGEELTCEKREKVIELIKKHREDTIELANGLIELGLHKSIVNRYLEPFSYIQVVTTTTQWDNFLSLRLAKDAEPHMQVLAKAIESALLNSVPIVSEYHLPFLNEEEKNNLGQIEQFKVSASRCAAISYLRPDVNLAKEIGICDSLIANRHSSPLEHPCRSRLYPLEGRSGPMKGWLMFRQILGQMS